MTTVRLAGARHLATGFAILLLLAACGETSLPFVPTPPPTPEQPRQLTVSALARGSGAPIAGAELRIDGTKVATGKDGNATVSALRGARVSASAAGFDAAEGAVPPSGDLRIEMRSNVVRGVVTDGEGKPVAGARIFVDGGAAAARSDAQGRYELPAVPEKGTLVYKMPGFRLGEIPIDEQMTKDVALEPFEAHALYAPASVFEAAGRLDEMLKLIDRTEINAMVIDVKETDGNLYWATDLPIAHQVGSVMEHPLFELDKLLPKLKERGIYTIARVVSMKDNTLGAARPELAVKNAASGKPWTDNGGGIWLDPSAPGVGEYLAAIAADLADKGFDEVQLDYVRFFSDGPYDLADTNLPNTQSVRLPAIRRVLRVVSEALAHRKAFLSADCFPIAFIVPDDQGIGQRPEVIMPYVDYFSPMVYPSHYGPGVFGFSVPNEHPYEVINESLKIMNLERHGLALAIRPWIQDFGYGDFRPYSVTDVQAEMKAARDNGTKGFMIWNASARFTEAALGPPRPDESAGPMTTTAPAASSTAAPTPSASAGP
ncbi:MAG: carboxypeptidase regulatory-like domain-containing protein [Chloroflexota bacterium]|nr:carboxypeptidase regulatory-like domain-containing protein [Chloroflexota bacterium]